ncbi:MAG: hypothetical protein KDB00_24200 [Planctomycetales bacterium]|nr:hypothetical protein [Planctomycetales bacterium]
MEVLLADYDSSYSNSAFASRSHKSAFGSFHPNVVTIRLDFPRGSWLKPWEIERFLKDNKDEDVRARKAIESFAYFHELRHFHDYFGTFAGINLFVNFLQIVREFAALSDAIRSVGLTWELPITRWAQRPDCPEPIRLFVHKYRVMSFARDVFLGRLLIAVEEGTTDDVWRTVSAPEIGMEFPVFASLARRINHETGKHHDVTVWQPLGFEALVEGTAQALQRTYLEGFWPESVVDTAWKLLMEFTGQSEFHVPKTALPYNLTDLLVSKFARQRGRPVWERDSLLKLTDNALMQSRLQLNATDVPSPIPDRKATNIEVVSRHPGAVFVGAMESADWALNKPVAALELSSEWLKSIRDSFADCEHPKQAVADPDASAIDVVEAFVRHEIIVPLLEVRVRYGADVFCNTANYFSHRKEFPEPIITSHHNDFETAKGVDDRILKKWAEFCLMANAMEQLLDGKEVIACPRAYSLIPAFEFFQMAEGGCTKHIQGRTCQTWTLGMLSSLPNCGFRNVVRTIALEN